MSDRVMSNGPNNAVTKRRIVLLGASNVARGISTLMGTLEAIFDEPLEVIGAIGNGRGYRSASRFIWRTLPAIERCGLWEFLANGQPVRTCALITDIGNDLAYGRTAEEIAASVDGCLSRLNAADADVVLCGLPVGNLDQRTVRALAFFHGISYPGSPVSVETLRMRAFELNERVEELADSRGLAVFRPPAEWYGIDPIHVKARYWRRAWLAICSQWNDAGTHGSIRVRPSMRRWLRLNLIPAERQQLLGRARYCEQPFIQKNDGASVAMF